jgi:hypothetical protein
VANTILKVLAADIILLLADIEVYLDLEGRSGYAASLHLACGSRLCGYTPSFSYAPLTYFFEMVGNSRQLISPPTLDWLQLLTLAVLIVNAWYLFGYLRSRRTGTPVSAGAK